LPDAKLYIHETIRISVEQRKAYLDHFCSWGRITRELYAMRCYGVWATVGSTGPWPEAIVLWELDGLDALARMLSGAKVTEEARGAAKRLLAEAQAQPNARAAVIDFPSPRGEKSGAKPAKGRNRKAAKPSAIS